MPGPQNVPKLDFQRQFSTTRIIWIFVKLIFIQKYKFRWTTYFDDSNFQTFYFLKLCPIFVNSALGLFTKYNNFLAKGQLISKANCQAVNSSKKRTNEFVFTTMQRVFFRFLEEIEDTKKNFKIIWPLYVLL